MASLFHSKSCESKKNQLFYIKRIWQNDVMAKDAYLRPGEV